METTTICKRAAKTLDKVISVAAIIAAVLMASFIFTWVTDGRPSFFGYRIVHVVSASMEPTIMTGDFVLVHTVDSEDVEVGDIVTYRALNESGKMTHYTIIHRVIDITDEGFIFKGDNNEKEDPNVVSSEQIGYVVLGIE